jgi:hypothetical protein
VITDFDLNSTVSGVAIARAAVREEIHFVILQSSAPEAIDPSDRTELESNSVHILRKDPFHPFAIKEFVNKLLPLEQRPKS